METDCYSSFRGGKGSSSTINRSGPTRENPQSPTRWVVEWAQRRRRESNEMRRSKINWNATSFHSAVRSRCFFSVRPSLYHQCLSWYQIRSWRVWKVNNLEADETHPRRKLLSRWAGIIQRDHLQQHRPVDACDPRGHGVAWASPRRSTYRIPRTDHLHAASPDRRWELAAGGWRCNWCALERRRRSRMFQAVKRISIEWLSEIVSDPSGQLCRDLRHPNSPKWHLCAPLVTCSVLLPSLGTWS